MSIVIQNVTKVVSTDNKDTYLLRINSEVICRFMHERKINGLSQCLRDAADAIDKKNQLRLEKGMLTLEELERGFAQGI